MKKKGLHFTSKRFLFVLLCLLFMVIAFRVSAFDRVTRHINPGWKFYRGTPAGSPQSTGYDDSVWAYVSLPHSHDMYNPDMSDYTRTLGWYRKTITIPEEYLSKRIFLEFQGAMQVTTLYVNGTHVGQYRCSGIILMHHQYGMSVSQ
jgi:beta-galactosidase